MNIEARVVSLSQRHAVVDRELETESHRPKPDLTTISELKREKLRLKDELQGLVEL